MIISDSGAAAAINMAGGTVIMNDGAKITNHKRTSGYGPAVYMTSGNFKMKGGTISGCESRNYGGAIYLSLIHISGRIFPQIVVFIKITFPFCMK